MPKSRAERKQVCRSTVLDLLQTYVTLMLKKTKAAPPNAPPESTEYYTAVARICTFTFTQAHPHNSCIHAVTPTHSQHRISCKNNKHTRASPQIYSHVAFVCPAQFYCCHAFSAHSYCALLSVFVVCFSLPVLMLKWRMLWPQAWTFASGCRHRTCCWAASTWSLRAMRCAGAF